jgi:hypothetical protein
MLETERKVAQALLREYGWSDFDPRRGGDTNGYAGWELIARKALEAANYQGAVDLLREVAGAGVEHEDPRVGYVTVQIDRATWDALAAYRKGQDG